MSIKRYKPKYKKLIRFRQPIWLENRRKIKNFKRLKWVYLKKNYFSRKFKFFNQDVASSNLGKNFDDNKLVRLKKTFRYSLIDKQKLQLYFGAGRLRYYQLKTLARLAMRFSRSNKKSLTTSFLLLLDTRIANSFYRVGFVTSLMQARQLVTTNHIKIGTHYMNNPFSILKKYDHIRIDPLMVNLILYIYIKHNFPFLFVRRKRLCYSLISKRLLFSQKSSFLASIDNSLSIDKSDLLNLKQHVFKKI